MSKTSFLVSRCLPAILFSAAAFGAGSVTTTKSNFILIEPVIVNFSGASGAANDWVGIFKAGAADTSYLTYQQTGGKVSGSFTFDIQEPGSYEARMFFRNSYTLEARASFTVSFPNTTVGTDKASYGLLDKIVVTFANMPGWSNDYITLVPLATPDNQYGVYKYTAGARNGTMTFDPPTGTSGVGNWEARALYRNENGPVRARSRFTIGEAGVTLQTNKSSYAAKESITVTYSGMAGYSNDWVGLFRAGDPNRNHLGYFYTEGKKSGSMTFSAGLETAGNYEARAFFANEYDPVRGRASFTVGTATCTYTLTSSQPSTFASGGGAGTIAFTASSQDCSWTASPSASWITITGAASGRGNGTVTYSIASNSGSSSRSGTIRIGNATVNISQSAASSSCNFLVTPLDASIGGAGGEILVQIVTALTCDWSARSGVDWITIRSGASGRGNGAVALVVAPNPSTTSSRRGTVTAGEQTVTITQSPGSSCTVNLLSTGILLSGAGATGKFSFEATSGCAWTATANAGWIGITSPTSGTGSSSVSYAVGANPSTSERSSSISINGKLFTIRQAGVNITSVPGIGEDGVVNTANYRSVRPDAGSMAQGGFFSIYGSQIGPEQFARATAYPLPTTLGGVSVRVTLGATSRDAYLVFASKGQINGVLSSSMPLGDAQVTVTYNGQTSAPADMRVSATDLGLFFQRESDGTDRAIAQNVASATYYPLNTPSIPAKPGQIVILWGTGMGAIAGADNVAPGGGDMANVPVEITVGGVPAKRLYAGRQPETAAVDNVYLEVPGGVPFGCNIPVQVRAGGLTANTVVISITAQGEPCR